ncbi:hypothetical protein AVEN_196250-1 [Araneus ventricosus]|uniref:Uncharacterized protein n=1 Tax=Araneus ventricosus TaxID=182803 RepID=A0A4Y2L922_ARAVE|nr:hypothetical protein AVEN_196250-1 [Araneus ventricosus]
MSWDPTSTFSRKLPASRHHPDGPWIYISASSKQTHRGWEIGRFLHYANEMPTTSSIAIRTKPRVHMSTVEEQAVQQTLEQKYRSIKFLATKGNLIKSQNTTLQRLQSKK